MAADCGQSFVFIYDLAIVHLYIWSLRRMCISPMGGRGRQTQEGIKGMEKGQVRGVGSLHCWHLVGVEGEGTELRLGGQPGTGGGEPCGLCS